jgi:hypothetical protein
VPAGQHTVVFHYQSYPDYGLLFMLSAFGIAGLLLADNLLRKRADSRIETDDDAELAEGDAGVTEGETRKFAQRVGNDRGRADVLVSGGV